MFIVIALPIPYMYFWIVVNSLRKSMTPTRVMVIPMVQQDQPTRNVMLPSVAMPSRRHARTMPSVVVNDPYGKALTPITY